MSCPTALAVKLVVNKTHSWTNRCWGTIPIVTGLAIHTILLASNSKIKRFSLLKPLSKNVALINHKAH